MSDHQKCTSCGEEVKVTCGCGTEVLDPAPIQAENKELRRLLKDARAGMKDIMPLLVRHKHYGTADKFKLIIDSTVPDDEIHIREKDGTTHKIINAGKPGMEVAKK